MEEIRNRNAPDECPEHWFYAQKKQIRCIDFSPLKNKFLSCSLKFYVEESLINQPRCYIKD